MLLRPIAYSGPVDIANRENNGIGAARDAIAAAGVTTNGKRLKRAFLPRSGQHLKYRPEFGNFAHGRILPPGGYSRGHGWPEL